MKILFAFLLIICGATIFTFDSMESSLLDSGFSWTMSKLFPYLLLGFGGILLAYSFAKGFKLKSKAVKIVLVILLFAAPFTIGFALNPIYEGDFSSEGTVVSASKVQVDAKYDLLIVTIPGCPFCLESISRLKLIQKHHPKAKLLFQVCSSDPKDLELYRALIAGDFDIALATDIEASVKLAGGHFPTFVRLKKGAPVYRWSNNQFGAGAIDSFTGEL